MSCIRLSRSLNPWQLSQFLVDDSLGDGDGDVDDEGDGDGDGDGNCDALPLLIRLNLPYLGVPSLLPPLPPLLHVPPPLPPLP